MATTVRDVMTAGLHTVGPDDPLARVVDIVRTHRVRHVPVVQDGRLLGVLTERDLSARALGPISWLGFDEVERQLQEMRCAEVMTSEGLITVHPSTSLHDAAHEMLDHKVGCLPVIEDGRLVGLLTSSDFVRLHAR